jgi:hypothetical protein
MTTPAEFVLSRLSRELYAQFLETARDRSFAFVRFRDFAPDSDPLPERFIALRHDIDFAPECSLQMAQMEHDAGVESTYFVLVDGQFYDPLRPETVQQIRHIRDLGHEIGLHFDSGGSAAPHDISAEVAFRMKVLEAIVERPIRSFAQHNPVNTGNATVTLPPGHERAVDVAAAIREHDLLYVSDSAMMWRSHTFATALEEGRNLCVLAHPHSWLAGHDDYVAMIRDFEARQIQEVSGRFDDFVNGLAGYYRRRLEEGV